MKMRSLYGWLALIVVATAVRAAWFAAKGGMYFPDEMFQYLEPGHWRVTGDAYLAWELEAGARHWILPAFWSSWLELGRAVGLRRWELHRFLALHAAVLSVVVVPAVFRMVRASTRDERAAWMAACIAALFPLLGYFAPHTLSELPAMLLVAFAHALWLEIADAPDAPATARRGWMVGVLLATAIACRVPSALSLPIIVGDLLYRRQKEALRTTLLGFTVAAGVLGVIDAVTWGAPWHSLVAFVSANLRHEGRLAREAMAEPWSFYLSAAWRCMGPAAPVLTLLSLLSLLSPRRHARLLVAWLVPFCALTFLANKQDRFLLPLLPMFLASAACGLAGVLGRLARPVSLRAMLGTAAVLSACALPAAARLPLRPWAGTFRAEAWIGARGDASGVLVDGGENANGGYLLLDRSIPLVPFTDTLAAHRLFNYVIAFNPALVGRMESDPSFERIATFESTYVFRRR